MVGTPRVNAIDGRLEQKQTKIAVIKYWGLNMLRKSLPSTLILLTSFYNVASASEGQLIATPEQPLFGDTHLHSSWSTDAGWRAPRWAPRLPIAPLEAIQ